MVSPDTIWVPRIDLTNMDEMQNFGIELLHDATVEHSGEVRWGRLFRATTTCQAKLSDFLKYGKYTHYYRKLLFWVFSELNFKISFRNLMAKNLIIEVKIEILVNIELFVMFGQESSLV